MGAWHLDNTHWWLYARARERASSEYAREDYLPPRDLGRLWVGEAPIMPPGSLPIARRRRGRSSLTGPEADT